MAPGGNSGRFTLCGARIPQTGRGVAGAAFLPRGAVARILAPGRQMNSAVAQQSTASVETSQPCALATMERLPPQTPRRNRDTMAERKVGEAKLRGQRVMAQDFDRQVAEFQVRVAVLNGFTAPGIPFRRSWVKSVRGEGKSARQLICATWSQARPNLPHPAQPSPIFMANVDQT